MTDPYLDAEPNIHSRFCAVASSLRDLANRLENFGLYHDTTRILNVSDELKQIGWATLFVSSSIDALVGSAIHQLGPSDAYDKTDQLRQVDSLQVAAEYLARNVRFLKTRLVRHDTHLAYPEINEAFKRLGDKLQEVAGECQRP